MANIPGSLTNSAVKGGAPWVKPYADKFQTKSKPQEVIRYSPLSDEALRRFATDPSQQRGLSDIFRLAGTGPYPGGPVQFPNWLR